jgi:hypothetical protein
MSSTEATPENAIVLNNFGGQHQLCIENALDLANALELDNALWMATSVPVDGLHCDESFLKILDTEGNGRIRADEMRSVIKWTLKLLKNQECISERNEQLFLGDLNEADDEAQKLIDAAKHILNNLGEPDGRSISLPQIRDTKRINAEANSNGDGVVIPGAASDETAEYMKAVMSVMAPEKDASGQDGLNAGKLDAFKKEADLYLNWWKKGCVPEDGISDVMPWGDKTRSVAEAVEAVHEKVEEYFAQCRLAAADPQIIERLKLSKEELEALSISNRGELDSHTERLPLAPVSAEGVLSFEQVNLAFKKRIDHFRTNALTVMPRPDTAELDEESWHFVLKAVKAYQDYMATKPAGNVGKLGVEKLEQHLASECEAEVREMIKNDLEVADEVAAVSSLEKLILCQQNLLSLARNYVSFSDLYQPEKEALFQEGRLIMNGTEFTFNLKVTNRAQHKKSAANAYAFVMYVEMTGKDTSERFEVATAVTSGDAKGLYTGRRGIFTTPDGKVWDARVVDLISQPVSIWEALKSPFARLAEFAEKQVEKFSGGRYKDLETRLDKELTQVQKSGQEAVAKAGAEKKKPDAKAATPQAAKAPASNGRSVRDVVLAVSVGFAALGSSFAFITKTLSQVRWWHWASAMFMLAVIVIVPLIGLAFLKLRRRNLSPILEASGWAVNGQLPISAALGYLFTHPAQYPDHAVKARSDSAKSIARYLGHRSRLVRVLMVILFTLLFFAVGVFLSSMFGPQY